MALSMHDNLIVLNAEFKHRDIGWTDELRGNRSANQCSESFLANGNILFGLYNADLIPATLCLNWKDVMRAMLVNTNVDFIDLNLTDANRSRSQVVLERIAGDARKHIEQAIVSNLREQCLFIACGVTINDTWRGTQKKRNDRYRVMMQPRAQLRQRLKPGDNVFES